MTISGTQLGNRILVILRVYTVYSIILIIITVLITYLPAAVRFLFTNTFQTYRFLIYYYYSTECGELKSRLDASFRSPSRIKRTRTRYYTQCGVFNAKICFAQMRIGRFIIGKDTHDCPSG